MPRTYVTMYYSVGYGIAGERGPDVHGIREAEKVASTTLHASGQRLDMLGPSYHKPILARWLMGAGATKPTRVNV